MTDSRCKTLPNGIKRWFNERGEYHRPDGPAVEYTSGYTAWWVNGKLHRLDGPAFEWSSSTEWWVNGQRLTQQQQFDQHSLVIFYRLCKDAT